jgi:predicted deacylase
MGAEAILLADDSGGMPFDESSSKLWWELARLFPEVPIPLACVAATVELRGVLDTELEQAAEDAENIVKLLRYLGYLAGEESQPEILAEATPLEGVDYLVSDAAGILSFTKELGSWVEAGEGVAEVLDPLESESTVHFSRKTIRAQTSGKLFARSVDRFSRPGKIIAKIAGTKCLQEGSYLLTD